MVKILKLNFKQDLKLEVGFGQHFAADVLVEILKMGLVKISNFKFRRDADVGLRF